MTAQKLEPQKQGFMGTPWGLMGGDGGHWRPMGTAWGPREDPVGTHGDPMWTHGDPRRGPLTPFPCGTDVNALGSAIADALDNFNNSCNSTAQTKLWIPSFAQIAVAKGNLMTHESASLR